MQTTVRTTIRIREDLLRQSRLLALEKSITLQTVVNELLAKGLGHVSDLKQHKQAMRRIDQFRESLRGRRIDINKILLQNKKDLK